MRLSPSRLQEIDQAFDEALDVSLSERPAFLADLAARDQDLASAVAALLDAAETADARLESLVDPDDVAALPDLRTLVQELAPGDEVGRFRIIRELGRGGMAVVYLAARADGIFEQQVAIKRLHHGLGALGGLRRFHRERQILATLNHASISRLLDGGVDAAGFPYLVMEYVEGTPIDRYADARALPIRARLDLFVRVARAVDYAHRHLVVHRDIKPSNILVTAEGDVKLLDFGIATLVDSSASSTSSPRTETIVRALTPEYASPEQLSGARVTIASDVYQLGLLLYELIAGVRARQIESGSLLEAAAACQQPVTRPSAVVAAAQTRDQVAAARGASPAALARALRGDLDNIVGVALNAGPDTRYATAAALADDVLRHLSGRAVHARGEAPLYRARRFARRHALSITAATVIVFLLVVIAITSSVQTARLSAERDRVQVEAAKAQGVTRFLLGLFEMPATAEANYASLTARDVLEYRAARIDDLADQSPVVQAEIMSTVGYALLRLGSHDRGIALITRSLEARRSELGDEHADTAESLYRLGAGLNLKRDYAAAEPVLRQALAIRERLLGPDHVDVADTLTELANALRRSGQLAKAEQVLIRALAIDRAAGSEYEARVLNNLGLVQEARGDAAAAERSFAEAIAYRRARFGDHPDLPINLINLGRLHLEHGAPEKAIPLLEEALARYRKIYGDAHARTTRAFALLASAHRDAGDLGSAERISRAAEQALGRPPQRPQ